MANSPALTESRQRVWLWLLPAAPVIWATHFMVTYVSVALWCGMVVGRDGSLYTARHAVALFSAVALTAIAAIGWRGYRAHAHGNAAPPHDEDTPEDRRRFLGFATLLLSGLSAVGVIYSAMAVVFIETCR